VGRGLVRPRGRSTTIRACTRTKDSRPGNGRTMDLMLTLKATDAATSASRAYSNQLKRAAISGRSKHREGYALGNRPAYQRHIRIALGSAAEAECLTR